MVMNSAKPMLGQLSCTKVWIANVRILVTGVGLPLFEEM